MQGNGLGLAPVMGKRGAYAHLPCLPEHREFPGEPPKKERVEHVFVLDSLRPGCCRATAGLLPGLSQANDHTSNPAYFSTSSEKMEFAQANHSRLNSYSLLALMLSCMK